ncbi:MAG: penicillin-binding protein 1A [Betaproteobacteria bacterium]|nr:penicillin-binding protein 1A [Betaproteobacteria bacterium]
MAMFTRWWHYVLFGFVALGFAGAIVVVLAAVLMYPNLPPLTALTHYEPKMALRVYTADGTLIGEFGERRALIPIGAVPPLMKDAILAAEDARFYQEGAIDFAGVLRAGLADISAGAKVEGASTITMQVARNFFLSRAKTFSRKFSEVLLSYKIEHTLTKDQILDLYINQIYLGQRAYGFEAAAETYFGKPLKRLSLAQMAVLAGLPKAPSRFNPVASLKLAKVRQAYVLGRMRALRMITADQYRQALTAPLDVRRNPLRFGVDADYVAEMVRQYMYGQYQEAAYTSGFKVYTTISRADQRAADHALWTGVLHYDWRHGYRGPEAYVALPADGADLAKAVKSGLDGYDAVHGLRPAVVLAASRHQVRAMMKDGHTVEIRGPGLVFAHRALSPEAPEKLRLRRGSVIRLLWNASGYWEIVQLPQVGAALVAMDPQSGAVRALVGGFDFARTQYNHATDALRQPGSSFKPFLFSAALTKGFTPATIVDDAPIVIDPAQTGNKLWQPKDYENHYDGPITLRTALAKSKNLVAIRVLQAIGIPYALDYIQRFGFNPKDQPPYLTMALGAGSVTPFEMAGAYSVFANGGYRVTPYFIGRIVDERGQVLFRAKPAYAGAGAPRVISARNAFVMTSLMQSVIRRGTGMAALQLGRADLSGKTGTTNHQFDAWFDGFLPGHMVAIAWMGYDQPRSLGHDEVGAVAALPIWMDYMRVALAGIPEVTLPVPDGVVTASIDPQTGMRLPDGAPGAKPEYFYASEVPPFAAAPAAPQPGTAPAVDVRDQLF